MIEIGSSCSGRGGSAQCNVYNGKWKGGVLLQAQGSHRGKCWCDIVSESLIEKEQLSCHLLLRHLLTVCVGGHNFQTYLLSECAFGYSCGHKFLYALQNLLFVF